mmetsp:Transcript_65774/g.140729  ORF Transcript_65774/g.140729 Transcript_65774/m.140729 type:complete len:519 (+) Transcript_65774:43-1599(+)
MMTASVQLQPLPVASQQPQIGLIRSGQLRTVSGAVWHSQQPGPALPYRQGAFTTDGNHIPLTSAAQTIAVSGWRDGATPRGQLTPRSSTLMAGGPQEAQEFRPIAPMTVAPARTIRYVTQEPVLRTQTDLGTKLPTDLSCFPDVERAGCSVSTAAPGCSVSTVAMEALESSVSSSESSDQQQLSGRANSREQREQRASMAAAPYAAPQSSPRLKTPRTLALEPAVALCECHLRVGAHTRAGTKLDLPDWKNQDAHLLVPLGEGRLLAAVFDGHGQWGHLVAARAREVFAQQAQILLPQAPVPLSEGGAEVRAALTRIFAEAQEALAREMDAYGRPLAQFSGTTATAAFVDAATCTAAIAHVGDSALALAAGEQALYRTKDHTVDGEVERRVSARGGEVQTFTISGITARRICLRGQRFPGLAMGRALGDLTAHNLGTLSEPEVRVGLALTPGTALILASDGVWEQMSVDAAAQCAASAGGDAQQAAWSLVESARARWPQSGNIDDITALVVQTSTAPA